MFVGELNQRVPPSQSALSELLSALRRDELVATRREAQTIYYRLADDRVETVMETLYQLFCAWTVFPTREWTFQPPEGDSGDMIIARRRVLPTLLDAVARLLSR